MSASSFAALRKDAQKLLAQINSLSHTDFEQRLRWIFVQDSLNGPLAVAWLLQQMLKISTAQDAPFWYSQIAACKNAARVGHKVRRGWEVYGMTPWEVVHHRGYYRNPLLARYHSEPDLRK